MDTFEKRSHYFRELSLCLQRNGFTTQNDLKQMLSVEWEERPLCRITEAASVLYQQNPSMESALHQATDIACTIYEYMAILDQAPTLKADGLAEPYRLISEFNGTVLAAKESRYHSRSAFLRDDQCDKGMASLPSTADDCTADGYKIQQSISVDICR